MTTEFRVEPPTAASERELLQGFLDWQRGTLLWKISGLTGEQLVRRSAEPSSLSLIGLIRHLGEVEKYWFHRGLAKHPSAPRFWTAEHPDGDFDLAEAAQAEQDLEDYKQLVRLSDELAARYDLDDTFIRPHHEADGPYSLRYVYIHMIEEYARHNGHADLIRERIDGQTGE